MSTVNCISSNLKFVVNTLLGHDLFSPNYGISPFFPTVIFLTVFFSQVSAIIRNVLLLFFSYLNNFNFQYSNFCSSISFIFFFFLIYFSLQNLHIFTIRSLIFLKVLNKVNFRLLAQAWITSSYWLTHVCKIFGVLSS